VYRVTLPLPSSENLAKELAHFEAREQRDLDCTDEMLAHITGSTCFAALKVPSEHVLEPWSNAAWLRWKTGRD